MAAGDKEQRALLSWFRGLYTGSGLLPIDGVALAGRREGLYWPHAGTVAADWPAGTTRYFAVDYDNGNDENIGFSDIDMASAGAAATALKTLEELAARLPKHGMGRIAVVAIRRRAGGATYRNKTDTADDDINLRGVVGYRRLVIRGTDTNTTAGSVAFANDSADKIFLGEQQVAGTNATGYNPTGAITARTFDVQLNGGGAPALAAEPALIGKRIRFDSATATVALRNAARMIWQNDTDTITLSRDLPAVPAAADVFYIEEPGVRVGQILLEAHNVRTLSPLASFNMISVAGFAETGLLHTMGSAGELRLCCIETASSLRLSGGIDVRANNTYTDETGATITGGVGFRSAVSCFFGDMWLAFVEDSAGVGAGIKQFQNLASYLIGAGCYFSQTTQLLRCGLGSAFGSGTSGSVNFGSRGSATQSRARLLSANSVAGLDVVQCQVDIHGVDIQNAGALPAVGLRGVGMAVTLNDVVGSTGNTDVGLALTGARACQVVLGVTTANTVTGTAGDIRLAGPAVTSHASPTITNISDNQGNSVQGTGGAVVGQCVLVSNQSGGALAVGDIVRSNATTQQVTKAQADTAANAGGPLLAMVTTPASTALGYAVPLGGGEWVNFDAAPAAGALAYLDEGTAGVATTTVPPLSVTNQKRRLGHTLTVSGTMAQLVGSPELLPITSDGLAP